MFNAAGLLAFTDTVVSYEQNSKAMKRDANKDDIGTMQK